MRRTTGPGGAVGAALAEAAAVGPFFAWEQLPNGADGWRPWAELGDAAVVAERVRVARARLVAGFGLSPAEVPERVVASVLSLGWASRLVSAPLAAVAVAEVLPAPGREQVWWRPVDSGPVPVASTTTDAVPTADLDDAAVAARFADVVLGRLVEPVLAVFQDRFRLSPKVVNGNLASALGGAVKLLAAARPGAADRAGRVLERLLAQGSLVGSASLHRPQWTLERNNCCLYYRIPGGGYCGDCVLRRNALRS